MHQKFFISFNSKDRDKAHWIAVTLRDHGHEVAVFDWDVPKGGNAAIWMQKKIDWADRLIAVISPDYMSGTYSIMESAAATWMDPHGETGSVIPVLVKSTQTIPALLRPLTQIDLTGVDENEAIRRLVNGVESPRPPTEKPAFDPVTPHLQLPSAKPLKDRTQASPPSTSIQARNVARQRPLPRPILSAGEPVPLPGEPNRVSLAEFEEWEGWSLCLPVKEVTQRHLRIQRGHGDPDYFCRIQEFDNLVKLLKENQDVLVCGKPKSGKTRLAWQAMHEHPDAWLLYLIPSDKEESKKWTIPRLPDEISRAFLFYDDLEKYSQNQDPEHLLRRLDPNRTSLVITLRLDPEYSRAAEKFGEGLGDLEKVEIGPVDITMAETAAEEAGIQDDWEDGFDGTVGWIMLGPRAKSAIFDSWKDTDLPRTILCACKLLRFTGSIEYFEDELRSICTEVFRTPIPGDAVWRSALHELDSKNFLLERSADSIDVYDAILDQVVSLDIDCNVLSSLLTHWVGNQRFDRLDEAVDLVWDDEQRELTIRALERCIEVDADRAWYRHLLAQLMFQEDDAIDQELDERRKAAILEPTSAKWAGFLGNRLANTGNPEAEKWLRQALELDKDSSRAQNLADYLSSVEERRTEAIEFYRQAVELEPKNAEAAWSLASLLAVDPENLEEACDFAIAGLPALEFMWVASDEIPEQLRPLPRWQAAWIENNIRLSFVYCDETPLKELLQEGWITGDELGQQIEIVILEQLANFVAEDHGNELAGALANICENFNEFPDQRPVADSALRSLTALFEQIPEDQDIAMLLLGSMANMAFFAPIAVDLQNLRAGAESIMSDHTMAKDLQPYWALFLAGSASCYSRWHSWPEFRSTLAELQGISAPDEPESLVVFAHALALAGAAGDLVESGKPEEAQDRLNELKQLAASSPENPDVQDEFSRGLAVAASAFASSSQIVEAERCVDLLLALVDEGTGDVTRMEHLAHGIGSLSAGYASDGDIEKMENCLQKLINLASEEENANVREILAFATAAAVPAYGLLKQFHKLRGCLDRLKQLTESDSGLPENIEMWAQALGDAASAYGTKKDWSNTMILLNNLEELQNLYQDLDFVRVEFCFALANAISDFDEREPHDDVERCLVLLKDQANDYPDDLLVLQQFTRGLTIEIGRSAAADEEEQAEALLSTLDNIAVGHADTEIALNLAYALSSIINFYGRNNKWARLSRSLVQLDKLCEVHLQVSEIRALYVTSLSIAVDLYGFASQIEELAAIEKKLSGLRARFPEDAHIVLNTLVTWINCLVYYGIHGQPLPDAETILKVAVELQQVSEDMPEETDQSWGLSTVADALLLARDWEAAAACAAVALKLHGDWSTRIANAAAMAGLEDFYSARRELKQSLAEADDPIILGWYVGLWNLVWPPDSTSPSKIKDLLPLLDARLVELNQ